MTTTPIEPAAEPLPHVLLVEDEPTILITLKDELEEHGYRVTDTDNGATAIALVAAQRFDVVITDLRLPGADGLQVLQAARRHHGTRVLVITAFAAADAEAMVRRDGGGAVLRKPFRNRSVLDWLRSA